MRTIKQADLAGKRVWDAEGVPLFQEPQQQKIDMEPIAKSIETIKDALEKAVANIPRTEAPIVNLPVQEPPHITVSQPEITVQAPEVSVDVNMQPVADAISSMAEAIAAKPDHGEQILDLLQKIADRPATATWSFDITRDNNGNIASVQAVKSNND